MTPRQRRRIGVLVGIALIVPLFPLGASSTALGSSIDDKRAEAARIQAKIDEQAEVIATLDRHLDGAQRRADGAAAAVRQARAEVAESDRRMAETSGRLAAEAVEAYVQGDSTSVLEQLKAGDGKDLAVRSQYIKATAAEHRQVLDQLKAARQDLNLKRARVEDAERSAESALSSLTERLGDLAKGESAQRANLARVNGELGQLLRAEQARQGALALQRAQAEAARAAATRRVVQTGPSPGSPGGMWTCIRQLESSNNYRTPGGGAYQFKNGTWEDMGGTGRPEDADPATQDAMAVKLQQQRGWQPWPTARRCGGS